MDLLGKIKRTLRCQYNRFIYKFSKSLNENWFDHIRFRQITGRKLDYSHPIYLNDKLMWLNRYWKSPLKVKCADKVRVHGYLKDKGLETYAVPLLTIWNSADEIELDQLPNQFVLKCNHGCGYNIIVTNKSSLDIVETREKLNRWLKEDYGKVCNEYHYSHIQPLVFAEQYIPSFAGGGG